jgi:ATP-dependent DNA helicase DinG
MGLLTAECQPLIGDFMRGELVALDLETTGFDPANDAIIEVGLVRIVDGEIVEEDGRLVNPERPIPEPVSQLTGIRNEDVLGKPTIEAVLPLIRAFVGNAPVIGHNVGFDLAFLNQRGILQNNLRIDTYDLASILMPRAPRYTLSSLANQVDVDLENAHRALDDARATALLYWLLWKKTLALPSATIQEIVDASQGLDWPARHVLEAALLEQRATPPTRQSDAEVARLFGAPYQDEKALRANDTPEPLSVDTVVEWIGEGSTLAERIPDYGYRPGQVEMARAVAEAFNQSKDLMVEAGTGTGKSLAYLLPSVLWATSNHERVVISTNTINLQEQLIQKDIPLLAEALQIPFKASILKGRGNYLCPRRLIATRRRRPTHVDELRTLAKILVWLLESGSGDRGEITLRGPVELSTWQRMSAEDEGCTLDRCKAAMQGVCPFYKARKAAEAAHIIVVNHALLLADAVSDNRVLPDYQYLVLDEAHHLEEATTNGLSFRLDEATLIRRLADLGGPKRGLLGDLLNSVENGAPEKDAKRLAAFVNNISSATGAMEIHIRALFEALREFYTDIAGGDRSGDYVNQVRITPQLREKDSFLRAGATWTMLKEFFDVISSAMVRLGEALGRLQPYHIQDYDDLVNGTHAAGRYLNEISAQLTAFTQTPDENMIYWISAGQNLAYLAINSAPLHVGGLVNQYLWSAKKSVVMTSATLQVNGSFDYLNERLNATDVETLEVDSPFDYQQSTLVYIPDDMPEPTDRHHYQQSVERGLIELAAALDGRVMALFTSYTQLRQTAQAISPRLALGNITVYDQSDGSSRQTLLDGFKSTEKAVLLGTKSFWEGVDIPGESLSALVITRLPFAVPTDPIFAARSETYKDSFKEYAVPDAILRFRQGFGRLIRSQSDRGVVVIFDKRIISKAYGENFLHSLPDCKVQKGALRDLPTIAKKWVNGSSAT